MYTLVLNDYSADKTSYTPCNKIPSLSCNKAPFKINVDDCPLIKFEIKGCTSSVYKVELLSS